ncbi:MAG: copper resistance protein B [Pseudomonas sp.]|uniref:copper resistance protein B n=1 Tax=Pseudomonas sp. TaxID=306 RepID=UPI003398A1EE
MKTIVMNFAPVRAVTAPRGNPARALVVGLSLLAGPLALAAETQVHAHPAQAAQAPAAEQADHSAMGHGQMSHGQAPRPPAAVPSNRVDPTQMDHSQMGHGQAPQPPNTPIPVLTEADRLAAFPTLPGHAAHDRALYGVLLFDQFEYQDAAAGSRLAWDASGWIGGDIDRLWFRSEGERTEGDSTEAELQLLYGHSTGPWWDLLAGVRQDFSPGSPQTWAALGVQGSPLYGVDVEATAFLGERGQTGLRLEADYDLLLTNRLILQPSAQLDAYGQNDPAREVGAGLASSELGLRLRYEIVRQFAPYLGVTWRRAHGRSADLLRDEGEDVDETALVVGLRWWF